MRTLKTLFNRQTFPFVMYYGVIYMAVATFSPYINLYYNGLGYTLAQIGVFTSIGPLVSIVAQPLWGLLSDKTNKKRVLLAVLTGSLIVMSVYALKTAFLYIVLMALLYNACFSSAGPLGDALTLQFIEGRNVKFANIRLVGTISYAIMAAVAGRMLAGDIGRLFMINAVLLLGALVTALWMPGTAGNTETRAEPGKAGNAEPFEPAGEKRAGFLTLLKNKTLLCVYLSAFIFGLTMTFYHSFVGLRIAELGAGTEQVGIAMLIAAASEIPVLIFIEKVFGKMKPVTLLMLTGLLLGIRLFLLFFSTTVITVYCVQLLHGFTFMVPYYFSVIIINEHAPAHLKSTAQSVYAMFRGGLAALTGTFGGGFLAQAIGIRNVYLFLAALVTAACCVLPAVLLAVYKLRIRKNKN